MKAPPLPLRNDTRIQHLCINPLSILHLYVSTGLGFERRDQDRLRTAAEQSCYRNLAVFRLGVYEQNHGRAGGERVGRLSPALLRATAASATQRWSWRGAGGGRSGNADAAAATSASALTATSANGAAWCPCAGEGTCKTGAESWRAPPCTCIVYRGCATATAPVHDQCSPTIAPVITPRARALTTSKGRQLGVTNARGAAGPAGCTTAPCCTAASRVPIHFSSIP